MAAASEGRKLCRAVSLAIALAAVADLIWSPWLRRSRLSSIGSGALEQTASGAVPTQSAFMVQFRLTAPRSRTGRDEPNAGRGGELSS